MLIILLPFIFLAAILSLQAQGTGIFAPVPRPLIQWQYSWLDGMKANMIGSAKNGDPVPLATSYLLTGYSPAQISQAYSVNQCPTNADGSGQTIAVIVAYGNTNAQHDLDTFCTKFGIPSTAIQTYYPNGVPVLTSSNSTNWSGWASETSLDIEWAHAMAPGASIALVVDLDAYGTDQCVDFAVTNLNAKIISMSYGSTEYSGETSEDSYFQSPGVAYLAAAGDNAGEIDYPAVSPGVIGVGGTTMYLISGVFTEKAWSDTGGGTSTNEPLPSYQLGVNTNSSGRGTPDVSAVADPYTGLSVYFTDPTRTNAGGWIISGGTSASTPIWAGIMARRASCGLSNDHFQSLLYSKQTNFWPCKDITNGKSAYRAVKGYDLATGLGSPRADQIVTLDSNSIYTAFSQSINFSAIPTKTYKKSPAFKLAATATSKLSVTFSILSGPATSSGTYGNTVTLLGGGTLILTADQSGNAQYAPAPTVTSSVIVNAAVQSISFPSLGIKHYSTNSLTLSAKATSQLPITYLVTNGPVSLLTSNTIVTTGVGSVLISASQPGNSDYQSASKLMSFKVVKSAQKITPFIPITNQITTNSTPFSITLPTASSGLPVTVAVKSGPATISSNTISLLGSVGTVVLTANQPGETNSYLAAPQVWTSFKVKAP